MQKLLQYLIKQVPLLNGTLAKLTLFVSLFCVVQWSDIILKFYYYINDMSLEAEYV